MLKNTENKQKTYFYQLRLREELVTRIDRNPRYSLRSFAQAIGVGSSALSQILAGKRSVSTKVIERIFTYLEFSALEQKEFIESVIAEKKEKDLQRVSPELKKMLKQIDVSGAGQREVHSVGLDEFRIIADWYHYAILELTFAKNFKADPRWIARELNITPMEAKLAIDRLLQLELLEEKNGTLKKAVWNLDTKDKTKTTMSHRRRQKQILEKSMHALEHTPIDERNHSSLTMCIDPKNLPEAKQKIQKLMWELSEFLVQGTPERVYELNLGLFPLQNGERK
jgi:uncharacterized protein (TIGR02147 family)